MYKLSSAIRTLLQVSYKEEAVKQNYHETIKYFTFELTQPNILQTYIFRPYTTNKVSFHTYCLLSHQPAPR